MAMKEIARDVVGRAANLALRMPISWVNILAGPPVGVDGRTLDGRTQWFLQLLARSGQPAMHQMTVREARAEFDIVLPLLGGRPAPVGEIVDRTIAGPAGRMRIRLYRPAGTVARLLPAILYFHGGGWSLTRPRAASCRRMSWSMPGRQRVRSTSSMRTSHWPACARASSQLASAATSEPACSGPVGEGANRPVYMAPALAAARAALSPEGTVGLLPRFTPPAAPTPVRR